jgi:glucosamine 6-phosphate synthetase-like amidotransferase/phosphosugar isomerase protein
MCVMAAYVGGGSAAAVLLRMLEAQEGIDAGHYSGIATIHEGKIHFAKVCGSVSRLRSETDAAELPGTVGIAHSRTPGLPLQSLAHPFLASCGKVIYCANGSAGRFQEDAPALSQRAYDLLIKAGRKFSSEQDFAVGNYPLLRNGRSVHRSDLLGNLVAHQHQAGDPLLLALRNAFSQVPSEIAALALSLREPGQVSALRFNQPLMFGRKDNAFYLATSAIAFIDEDINWINPVPLASTLSMTAENINIIPMDEFSDLLQAQTMTTEITARLDRILADGQAHTLGQLRTELRKLWPENKVQQAGMYIYEYLREKILSGEVERTSEFVPASRPGDQAPCSKFRSKAALA